MGWEWEREEQGGGAGREEREGRGGKGGAEKDEKRERMFFSLCLIIAQITATTKVV